MRFQDIWGESKGNFLCCQTSIPFKSMQGSSDEVPGVDGGVED